jgi:Ni/Fe-hydrogenase subunit HybB-like protein
MDYGIYYIDNTLTDWQPYNNNLPNVIINELEINSLDNKIYAASYGRGLWASPLVVPTIGVASFLSNNDILIYPNPAKERIQLLLQDSFEADLRVFDTSGKLVIYRPNVSISNEYAIDISKLNKGLYFLRINSNKGVLTKKIIKN